MSDTPVSYTPSASGMVFRVPTTLASDFDKFLSYDIPNTVRSFTLYHNWYQKDTAGFTPPTIRGELYPDSTKSRYTNTDNNINFRASLTSGIKKGDILVDPDGEIYVLDWEINHESNNAPSRLLRCNSYVVIKRNQKETVDERGYLVTEGGLVTIATSIPCNLYRYDGKPEYSVSNTQAGITPNSTTICTMQFNATTNLIRIDDIFTWGNDTYRIVDVNRTGVAIGNDYGVLVLQCFKEAGGQV